MSRLLTWVLRLLPALGVFLALVGSQEWYPENWLDSKGFVINLASGFTAACFGIPFAYFVIQKLLRERDERARRAAVTRVAVENLQSLRKPLEQLIGLYKWADGAAGFTAASGAVPAVLTLMRQLPPSAGSFGFVQRQREKMIQDARTKVDVLRRAVGTPSRSRDQDSIPDYPKKVVDFVDIELRTRLRLEGMTLRLDNIANDVTEVFGYDFRYTRSALASLGKDIERVAADLNATVAAFASYAGIYYRSARGESVSLGLIVADLADLDDRLKSLSAELAQPLALLSEIQEESSRISADA